MFQRTIQHPLLDQTPVDNCGTNLEHDVPDALWAVLCGHRWHATSLDGLRGIVDTGAIEIRSGYNGLCKSLGAISLFDFGPTAVDIKSGGHWTQWCGSEQASLARLDGIPQKRVGVWLRVRDDYADDHLIDAGALHEIWKKNMRNVIPEVEGGHGGPLAIAELDQVVVIPARRGGCEFLFKQPSVAETTRGSMTPSGSHRGELPAGLRRQLSDQELVP